MSVLPHAEPACTKSAEPAVDVHIAAQTRDLGDGFHVRRLLPAPTRRHVGPFVFFDHMGPVRLDPGRGLDVRPHPHIGLATVTYLFDGEIVHRDSLGTERTIRPGAVNWMTAGRGIVHSERSPPAARTLGARVHGLQLWVALPRDAEACEPAFVHHAAGELPMLETEGARLCLVAGAAYGLRSPVSVPSPLFYVDAKLERRARLDVPDEHAERALYVVDGSIGCDGITYRAGEMLVFRPGARIGVSALEPARVVLIGGAPLDGERHVWWNFVASTRERIEQAKDDWKHGRFPVVPGDEAERVPLPEKR